VNGFSVGSSERRSRAPAFPSAGSRDEKSGRALTARKEDAGMAASTHEDIAQPFLAFGTRLVAWNGRRGR
jgi:hypothetical protein